MEKRKLLLFTLITLFLSCNPANSYNDKIFLPQQEVTNQLLLIVGDNASEESYYDAKQKVLAACDEGLKNIEELEDYNGNTAYREAAKKYFHEVKNYFSTANIDEIFMKFYNGTLTEEEAFYIMERSQSLGDAESQFFSELKRFALETDLALK